MNDEKKKMLSEKQQEISQDLQQKHSERQEELKQKHEELQNERRQRRSVSQSDLQKRLNERQKRLSTKHHMAVPWHDLTETEGTVPASEADLGEKASLVGRVGLMMLAVGTGAWRVRASMNTMARSMGITCTADVGLLSIEYSCFDGSESVTEALSLNTSGVNTDKLASLEAFVREFPERATVDSVESFHNVLDDIQKEPGNYSPVNVGLAAALACCGFTFLLGGGPWEMLCAFLGAGFGNWLRRKMLNKHIALIACIAASVAFACCIYVGSMKLFELAFHVDPVHEAGYICSMLFIIPGFPLITGGIDLAKLDMRSGIERMTYAVFIITVATLTGWVTAMVLQFKPADFVPLELNPVPLALLRIVASFCGVYGFSLMFNSTRKMAALAGCIGMIANTLRLELTDVGLPLGVAAFIGAFLAGLLAFLVKKKVGYPRISLTVPSIVIMVPGLFMYRGIYHIGLATAESFSVGALWIVKAVLMVLALPLGLVFAQVVTDKEFRTCS